MTALILVVDDEEDNRAFVVDRLLYEGYSVRVAASGEQGISLAEALAPDLILMDIRLPDVDGYEATRRIKANPALRCIPIIAITSYALSGDEAKAREAGCDDYFAKPFDPADLVDRIREHLP